MCARHLHIEQLEDRRVLATLTVDNPLDVVDFNDGLLSLREAVFVANNVPGSDVVEFSSAVYGANFELTQGEIVISESLEISNPTNTGIGINALGQSRIFDITATSGNFEFGFLYLQGGKTTGHNTDATDNTFSGGAIRSLTTGSLTFNRTHVVNSSTTGDFAKGGGVFALGDVTLMGATVENNSTSGEYSVGGGIYASGSISLTQFNNIGSGVIINNRTTGNYAHGGGAFSRSDLLVDSGEIVGNSTLGSDSPGGGAFIQGDAHITEGVVRSNTTNGDRSAGGGIAIQSTGISAKGNLTFSKGRIQENQTLGMNSPGGALFVSNTSTIESTTISNNTTRNQDSSGGAIYSSGYLTLVNSTVSGNSTSGANSHGGGLYAQSDLDLAHVTISENRTDAENTAAGGAFVASDTTLTLNHAIVAGNFAQGVSPDLKHANGVLNSSYSLVGSNEGTPLQEAPVGAPDGAGNMIGGNIGGRIDPKLLSLNYNGGNGDTHLPAIDSPVINAGNANAVSGVDGVPFYDQRGTVFGGSFPRVQDKIIDIGAIELTLTRVDTLADENDGDYEAGDLSLREALSKVVNTQGEDIIVFDSALFQGGQATIVLSLGELEVLDDVTIYVPNSSNLTISAAGNDPTPGEKNGDGSRVFHVYDRSPGTLPTRTPHLEIHNLTLTGGDIEGRGGAVFVSPESGFFTGNALTVYSSLIYRNAATEDGGAIFGDVRLMEIANSTITQNIAGKNGGAIAASVFTIGIGNEFTRNFNLSHSTIADNNAGISGGGIALEFGGAQIENSIVAGNSATELDASDLWQENSPPATSFAISHSLIGISHSSIIDSTLDGSPDVNGNQVGSVTSPFDPRIGPLSDNGGARPTRALLPNSPAIDAGDPIILDSSYEFDQRGQPFLRIRNGNLLTSIAIDIGAYEAQTAPSADFDSDNDVDGADFLAWQRGFGTTNATRAGGNSDDDTDADASDLAAWKVSFGQSQTLVAAVSEHLEVSGAALLDAASDWRLSNQRRDEADDFEATQPMAIEAVFASHRDAVVLHPTASYVAEDPSPSTTVNNMDKPSDPWLDEELLERVFG